MLREYINSDLSSQINIRLHYRELTTLGFILLKNRSYGRNGNYSTGFQQSGRDLLDPAEVRMLDNQYAILFIRGERAVKDFKYDILKHPNVKFTEDGRAEPFIHGTVSGDIADIAIEAIWDMDKKESEEVVPTSGYEILSEEDILEAIEKEEKEHEEKRD